MARNCVNLPTLRCVWPVGSFSLAKMHAEDAAGQRERDFPVNPR